MSAPDYGFLANDTLPHDTTVTLCKAAGYDCPGLPLCNQPSEPIIACVKYGPNVTIAEALTQAYCMLRGFSLPIQRPVCGSHVFMRPSLERPPTPTWLSATSSCSILTLQIVAKATTSWLQRLCRRSLASKVRAPRLDPSVEVVLCTTFSLTGFHQ